MKTVSDTPGWTQRLRLRIRGAVIPGIVRRSNEDLLQWLRPEEEPVEAELFGAEQLRQHAVALADSHQLAQKSRGDNKLLNRLADNAKTLEKARRALARAAAAGQDIPAGCEWLLDNFYLIQQQIRMARQHLPKKYSAELPHLSPGSLHKDGLPRVYDVALELIRHVAGQIDQTDLETFVTAYQSVADLSLGELWAIPIMLRLALIENIRRTAVRLAWRQQEGQLAKQWAERIAEASHDSLSSFIRTLGQLLSNGLPSNIPFAARFAERLEGQLPHDNVALKLLQQRLEEQGLSLDSLVDTDSQSEAADQVSIANSVVSLRSLDALDWKGFVENQSAVDKELVRDPAGVYSQMDFATRDHYRHVVERLARRSGLSERRIAVAAVELARHAAESSATSPAESSPRRATATRRELRERHVGYYLVGPGCRALERNIGYRRSWRERLTAWTEHTPVYLGAIAVVWLSALGTAVDAAWSVGLTTAAIPWATGAEAVVIAAGLMALFAAASSQFAVTIVNWLATLLVPPRPVLRLDFSQGIPRECSTLVAVPTMLTSRAGILSMVEQLEVRYLANRDERLFFALLTDFPDADCQTLPTDAELLCLAVQQIERLNAKYRQDRPATFFLFHRERLWNEREGVWMGWERKRGKLSDLNSLLRVGDRTPFATIVGDPAALSEIRYVITLDNDTGLPADAARKLVGCMAHPLNRPEIDAKTGMVVRGYGILQPRVTTTIPAANASLFSRLFAGDAGIDPYTRLSSNVYQDLFGEGTFMGKGIYDVYAFEASLAERFPENRVLSHDLIEGCFARSGLVGDVDLFEGFPMRLVADMSRRHRWTRGDWQIAAWLRRRIPTRQGDGSNPLGLLSRWKIFDNLRRSLHPLALLAFVVLGWLLAPGAAAFFTITGLALVFTPGLIASLRGLKRRSNEQPWRLHLRRWWATTAGRLARETIELAVLPYTVHCNLDAIVRALNRLCRTRRRLLEWVTADDAENRAKGSCRDHFELMWSCPVTSLGVAALLVVVHPPALLAALPLLALWLAGPAIAWRFSQQRILADARLPDAYQDDLRRWARCAWHYFETFSDGRLGKLVPDNVQWHPHEMAATRTSPTDLGMGLLATLSAHDLGYITTTELLQRCNSTLSNMLQLPRYRGHLYNWYDSLTLRPLEPRYVSSVDSGNLWGALVVLRTALEELRTAPLFPARLVEGLRDTLAVLAHYGPDNEQAIIFVQAAHDVCCSASCGERQRTEEKQGTGSTATASRAEAAHLSARRLTAIAQRVESLANEYRPVGDEHENNDHWLVVLRRQVDSVKRELEKLAFWLNSPTLDLPRDLVDSGARCLLDEFAETLAAFDRSASLVDLATGGERVARLAEELISSLQDTNGRLGAHAARDTFRRNLGELKQKAEHAAAVARAHLLSIDSLLQSCDDLSQMDFTFLYDARRKLLTIGYNVSELRHDASHYDLLASEARLASFLAVSHGQLPEEHWFMLGRMIADGDREPTLLSWSGSMFEYLMPMLFLPSYEHTLLDESCRAAVRRQIRYGHDRAVPWGISESCYNVTGADSAYQYRPFGIPGLALQRDMDKTLVVAPYASALALMVCPRQAWVNLRRLEAIGCMSYHGFFDAVDFTPSHCDEFNRPAVCRTVMAHHSGMSLLAMAAALGVDSPRRRLMADPRCRAHDRLLQERVPDDIRPVDVQALENKNDRASQKQKANHVRLPEQSEGTVSFARLRVFDSPHTLQPEIHLLSNEDYLVMLSAAGGGFSRWRRTALTRWREDPVRDCWGQFIYLRDPATGNYWSNTYQPTRVETDKYQAIFSQGQVEYRVVKNDFDVRTQISVSPEENVEIRRLSITNLQQIERKLELTTYAEVVLTSQDADEAHPAFGKLFVGTEVLPEKAAILCRRRPSRADEDEVWMFHMLTRPSPGQPPASFETSRLRFLGRHRTPERPQAMDVAGPLTGGDGQPLDPIVSIRRQIALGTEQTIEVAVVTGVANSREAAFALVAKYHDRRLTARVFEMARTHSQLMLQHLEINEADAQLYSNLASALLYHDPRRRIDRGRIARMLNRQDALWPLSIGGDLPLVLVRVEHERDLLLAEQITAAHAYWHRKAIRADLVIFVQHRAGYHQTLRDQVLERIISGRAASLLDQPGGIRVISADQCTEEQWELLQAVARIALIEDGGRLEERLRTKQRLQTTPRTKHTDVLAPAERGGDTPNVSHETQRRPSLDVMLFNGRGGFTHDGKEYIVALGPGESTPAPWTNVIANPHFGTLVTEAGLGCTWYGNSQQFRLTPWSNDPVSDPRAEVVYLRDEQSGRWISTTPQPCDSRRAWICRHGFGYTVWQGQAMELETELWTYVSVDEPVKFLMLTIRNGSNRRRRLSAFYYLEWVLGQHRNNTRPWVVTEIDPKTGAIFARNRFHQDFSENVAFVHSSVPATSTTCDRAEFLGRYGSLDAPAALGRDSLSGHTGAGLDPAAALQCPVEIEPGQQTTLVFVLGAANGEAQARRLARRFANITAAGAERRRVWEHWNRLLGTVFVDTPDRALNVLANGWLTYQTIACRLWGRTAFYQSSGAYGFRDQIQDVLSLTMTAPWLTREHLLRAAARQFREGDVQHWWHADTGRGVRTRITDDALWLPFAVARYVEATGDMEVLDESIPLLVERPLAPGEASRLCQPGAGGQPVSLYEHCRLALRYAARYGERGLPLFGTGDWNDAMDRVGIEGKGESVWLGFFLCDVLDKFAELARRYADHDFCTWCQRERETLGRRLDDNAWAGHWYLRGFFDDGQPLGAPAGDECQIDSLPQSWAALSHAGLPERRQEAMDYVQRRLVRQQHRLIQLFDPPLDANRPFAGYVQAYVPGVRENGGQYTQAAVWAAMAFAELGETEKAWECFSLLNPIERAGSLRDAETYRAEPYVMAADVSMAEGHVGCGGWTWYTGSAGWMYQLILESILGISIADGNRLRLRPCPPPHWPRYRVYYRFHSTHYQIEVLGCGQPTHHVAQAAANQVAIARLTLDGHLLESADVPMVDDGGEHHVVVTLV